MRWSGALVLVASMAWSGATGAEPPSNAQADPPEAWALVSRGHYLEALAGADLPSKPPDEMPASRAYLLGLCLLRVHRFSEARAYLELARFRNYVMPRGWDSPQVMLDRGARCEALRPPLRLAYPPGDTKPSLRLFAATGKWGDEVAADVPRLVEAARSVFPDRLTPTDVYLFDERRVYDLFFASLLGMPPVRSWQHGSGRVHAVVFCAQDRNGVPHPPHARERLPADLLHEYGHALCEARYGDMYVESIPQWLNEGLADAVARDRSVALYEASPRMVRAIYAKTTPPSYRDMSVHLYDQDPAERYALARLMVDQLLGARKNAGIAPLLDEARRRQDFAAAMTNVFKQSGEEVLSAVLRGLRLPTGADAAGPQPVR